MGSEMCIRDRTQREKKIKEGDKKFVQVAQDLIETRRHVLSARVVQQELQAQGLAAMPEWKIRRKLRRLLNLRYAKVHM